MKEDSKALQELYRELDRSGTGTRNLVWYGQLRALGYDHKTAIDMTKKEFHLD